MNKLSMLILAGDVSDRLGWYAFSMIIVLTVICLVMGLVILNATDDPTMETARVWMRRSVAALFLFAVVYVIMPSKTTFYLVASSEVGEQVLRTPEAQEMLQNVREWLRVQINPAKGDKK